MNSFNYKNSHYIVLEGASLEDAMVNITLNQRGAVVVIDDSGLLLGIVSDGDIRRALLQHATLITPISKIINMNVVSISDKNDVIIRSKEIFENQTVINLIPVIDKSNKVIDLIIRNPGVRKEL